MRYVLIAGAALVIGFIAIRILPNTSVPLNPIVINTPQATIRPTLPPRPTTTPSPYPQFLVDQQIDFASQAPFFQWSDGRFQDGCEEASSIMADAWVNNTRVSKQYMTDKIIEISTWQDENYGNHVDTSAADTAQRLLKNYFSLNNVTVISQVSKKEIITAILDGNILITPMDGQALDNPNYTAAGPERHMILVKGYDPKTDELITNDPGTRLGASYRYDIDLFYNAIRDYPTGAHIPITKIEKNVIVIGR